MTLLWLALACAGDPAGDSAAPVDSGAEAEACAQAVEHSGEAVGSVDCTDGVCEVPAGDFVMGAADPSSPDQCPERRVTLSAFAIDQHEVTRGEWAACVAAGACAEPPACPTKAEVQDESLLPVVCVDWQEARDYCAWRGGRLPSEAEWEKAARGDEGAVWPWGPQAPACTMANFRYVTSYCRGGVVEVGTYAEVTDPTASVEVGRSAWGLLDTVGNAWEWVEDWYDAGRYRDAPDTDPGSPEQCRLDPEDQPGECRYRVVRGGAYNTTEATTRGSARSFADPGLRDVNLGLRCAYDR